MSEQNQQNKMVARLLAEVSRLRGQLLGWRDLVERVENENKALRQQSGRKAASMPCSGVDLDRYKAVQLEEMLSEACDQNRALKMAKNELESALDEQDIQIEALQRKIATLEASLTRRQKDRPKRMTTMEVLVERLKARRLTDMPA